MAEPIFSLTKKDFDIQWFSGKGAGGQHRNKHQNCCRIIHKESGLSTTGQRSRSRAANQRAAFERLVPKVLAFYGLVGKKIDPPVDSRVVRVYHEPDNIVRDKASGSTDSYKNAVLSADLDYILTESVLKRKENVAGSD